MKGRDAQNLIIRDIPANEMPTGDEIFFLSGSYPVTLHSEEISNSASHMHREEDFSVGIYSGFSEFEGAWHILHNTNINFHGPAPDDLALPYLSGSPEVIVNRARLGIDLFQSHSFAFFGFAPFVAQTLLIEIDREFLYLRIEAERLKAKNILPLQREEIIKKLSNIFERFAEFNLLEDYQKLCAINNN